jgi:hypothetical protein
MTTEKLKQIFAENAIEVESDDYNKWMTESKFIEVVSELMNDTWIEIKSEDDLPKDDKNVLAMIDGEMKIMCLSDIIENGVSSKVWCLVYDGLDGDGIYDDNYYPTHWMPLPTHPQTKSNTTVKL